MKFSNDQIARGVSVAYNEGIAAVNTALKNAGQSLNDAAQAVRSYFAATDQQFASALNQAGYNAAEIATDLKTVWLEGDRQAAAVLKNAGVSADRIATALTSVFNESAAALYNTMQSINSGGQAALDAINGFFHTGAFGYLPFVFGTDGYNVRTEAWLWGDHDQEWYVLPTDGLYGEIVNRASGLCMATSSLGVGAGLVIQACTGDPSQQWRMSDANPAGNLSGLKTTIKVRSTGFVANILGGGRWANNSIGQWYRGDDATTWNQMFTFTPAVG